MGGLHRHVRRRVNTSSRKAPTTMSGCCECSAVAATPSWTFATSSNVDPAPGGRWCKASASADRNVADRLGELREGAVVACSNASRSCVQCDRDAVTHAFDVRQVALLDARRARSGSSPPLWHPDRRTIPQTNCHHPLSRNGGTNRYAAGIRDNLISVSERFAVEGRQAHFKQAL
jgi:hypothetical protein